MRTRRLAFVAPVAFAVCSVAASSSAQQPPPPAPVPQVVVIPAEPQPQPTAVQVVPVAPSTPPPTVQIVPVSPVAPAPPPSVVVQPPYPQYPYPVYVITLPPPPPQAPPPYVAPPPPAPPPPPPLEKGAHVHDGFYLRMGIGGGALSAVMGKDSDTESEWSTGGGAVELGMGGCLGDGFMLGGRILGVSGSSVEWRTSEETTEVPGSLTLSSVQLFGDWYPSPDGGFHVQLGLGPSVLAYEPSTGRRGEASDRSSTLEGFGGAIGVGWEGWVGDEWSLGAMLNIQFASFEGALQPTTEANPVPSLVPSEDEKIEAVAPMLLLTATYN